MEFPRGGTMSNINADEMSNKAKQKFVFYLERFSQLIGKLPEEEAKEFLFVLDELLFWQESFLNWGKVLEYRAIRDRAEQAANQAVYPPPGE